MNGWARRVVFGVTMLILGASGASAVPLGTEFTYQGQLNQSGSPVNGVSHFRFSLWDAASAGAQVGSSQIVSNVLVTGGIFTVQLNGAGQFGASAFRGDARWLQVEVCTDASCSSTTILTPRQALTASPYALDSKESQYVRKLDGGVGVQINAGSATNSPGIFADTQDAHDLMLGSFRDGSYAHGFISTGYWNFARKTSIGRRSSLDNATAVFEPQLTVVSNTGNVGIGTTTPVYPLSFASALGNKVSLYTSLAGGQYGFGVQNGLLQVFAENSAADVAIGYGSSGAFTERMRVKGNGNVGIGVQVPTDKLHIEGGRVRIEDDLAAAGQENLRIIRGSILGNGDVQHGIGFTAHRVVGSGRMTITFNVPFASPPSVTAIPTFCSGCLVRLCEVESVSTTQVVIATYLRSDGSYAGGPINFIAVGPR